MNSLRDAGMLLGALLLLASVKIGPVEGTGNVVPLAHAGGGPRQAAQQTDQTGASLEPVAHTTFHTVEETEMKITEDHECASSVIVIGTDDASGRSLVLRVGEAPPTHRVHEPARLPDPTLTTSNRG